MKFHIGDILSITTGNLVSLRHMEGVYDILNYMTKDNLFTHQLIRAMHECRPHLLEQFPMLKDVNVENVNKDNWRDWLQEQINKYGEYFDVKPLPDGKHKYINPIAELVELMNK